VSEDYVVISDPEVCGGKPVARGTPVPVQYILQLWDRWYDAAAIHEEYPTVPRGLIDKIIKHLTENKVLKVED